MGPIKIVKVAVNDVAYDFDKLYDYIVPVQYQNLVKVGQRVQVPFGRSNKKRIGMIFEIKVYDQEEQLPYFTPKGLAIKPIISIIDEVAIVNDEIMNIILWLKEHTFCKFFDAIKTVIPAGYNVSLLKKYKLSDKISQDSFGNLDTQEKSLINYVSSNCKGEVNQTMVEGLTEDQRLVLFKLIEDGYIVERDIFKRKIQDSKLLMVELTDVAYDLIDDVNNYKLTEKQKKVINFLLESEAASLKEVIYMCGVTKTVIDNLIKKGLIKYFEVEDYRKPYELKVDQKVKEFNLNECQAEVFNGLLNLINTEEPYMSLLRGVTGSGKTSIFINLMRYVVNRGKTAILLVPEIALTPQMINILEKHFGENVAILHSGLTLANRLDEWKRIKAGKANVVLGTRSAVFAPLENIGLIIMDEEQEESYKSNNVPRYHARDVAMIRTKYNNALFLMASATPSVEMYYKLQKKNFNIFNLNKRYNNSVLPEVSIVDMQEEKQNGNNSFFSKELILAIENNLKYGQQTIIFINRRGYNTIVKCDECNHVELCPNCDIVLTYHKANNKLMCHYCGYIKDVVKKCEKCGSAYIKYSGVGTQKIELQLEDIFPQAKILRLDADKIINRFSYDRYFDDFLNRKYDILIGTQMVAKGLNFPNVTLVGVIDADRSIYNSDYKGFERTYNILTQVIGRSGRGSENGRAIIQTNDVRNEIFDLVLSQDYNAFYNREILFRKKLLYPPFCDMAIIGLVGSNESSIIKIGNEIFDIIKELVLEDFFNVKLKVFGPVTEVISKINNKYRYKIFLKYKNDKNFRRMIDVMLKKILKKAHNFNVSIFFDKI